MCLVDGDPGALTERRVALTERTFGVWHGHVPGVAAGQRYGYRVHGPYRPWEGPRANPAKILVDPYARRITGAVTDLEAARGWTIDPMTGPPSTVDSLGHVPLSVLTAPPAPLIRPGPDVPWSADRDRRGARPRLHEAAPGRAARAARHLPRPGPSGRRRAPAPHRGDGRRAAARHRDAQRAPAAATGCHQLLGLLDPRLLRPAPGVRERARRGGRGVPGDGRRAARRRHRGHPRRGPQPHLRGRGRRLHDLVPRPRRPRLLQPARGPRRRHHRHRQHPRLRLADRGPDGVRRPAQLGDDVRRRRLPRRPRAACSAGPAPGRSTRTPPC